MVSITWAVEVSIYRYNFSISGCSRIQISADFDIVLDHLLGVIPVLVAIPSTRFQTLLRIRQSSFDAIRIITVVWATPPATSTAPATSKTGEARHYLAAMASADELSE